MHFYDLQNANRKGVTLKLPVSTMKTRAAVGALPCDCDFAHLL
jgi:hypothetical protein